MKTEREKRLEFALLLMVNQYCAKPEGYVQHEWMTAGELAFDLLGIDDFTPCEEIYKMIEEMRHGNA